VGLNIVMRPGTLNGMGRKVECFVGMPDGNYSHYSNPSIQNVPPDMPDGEYIFTFKNGSVPFKKQQGMWLENAEIRDMMPIPLRSESWSEPLR